MLRSFIGLAVAAVLLGVAVPVAAEERSPDTVLAPSKAVAAAWLKEDGSRASAKTVKALYGSYGVLQGLDMYSTIVARRRGAVEVNPLMNTGFTHAAAFKALTGAATVLTVKAMEKKSKKAAIITMIALNSVTALVVANNIRNARRLR